MDTPVTLSYDSLPDGGAAITAITGHGCLRLPLDHEGALCTAASILTAAGVREATFTGDGDGRGTIREAQS
jgi:hypothetical protein